jgi:hypothetical protein
MELYIRNRKKQDYMYMRRALLVQKGPFKLKITNFYSGDFNGARFTISSFFTW